jgi:hypothetical protein
MVSSPPSGWLVLAAFLLVARFAAAQDAPDSTIAAFAGTQAFVVGRVAHPPFTLFSVGSSVGVEAGGRIGWLRQPRDLWGTNRSADAKRSQWFDLAPDDSAIAATAVDPQLDLAPPAQLRVWRTVVAQSAVTPLPTLLALAKADRTLGPAIATSPRLLDTASSLTLLISLAGANDQVGAVVIRNPALEAHPRVLVTLAESHPALWPDAMRLALNHLDTLTASDPIDERMAVHLVVAAWTLGVDSMRSAVAALPAVRRSTMARTVLAVAADTIERQPPVSEVALRQLIGRIEADTLDQPWFPLTVGALLARSRTVRADETLTWTLATLSDRSRAGRERWRTLRTDILAAIAWDHTARLEDLRRVARALTDSVYWQHRPVAPRLVRTSAAEPQSREGLVARMLYGNPRARTDQTIMQVLAALPASEFGSVPALAQRQLQAMPRRE